jgi:hypothetical protein
VGEKFLVVFATTKSITCRGIEPRFFGALYLGNLSIMNDYLHDAEAQALNFTTNDLKPVRHRPDSERSFNGGRRRNQIL